MKGSNCERSEEGRRATCWDLGGRWFLAPPVWLPMFGQLLNSLRRRPVRPPPHHAWMLPRRGFADSVGSRYQLECCHSVDSRTLPVLLALCCCSPWPIMIHDSIDCEVAMPFLHRRRTFLFHDWTDCGWRSTASRTAHGSMD